MNKMDNILTECLEELNLWLKEEGLSIHLSIIGRFAFCLAGMGQLATLDIDSVTEIDDKVFKKITEIGKTRGMKADWLNDNAENLPLPDGFHDRLIECLTYSNIKIKYASRFDLIALKAAAYLGRGEDDPKDYQDLILLHPTSLDIDNSITYIRQHFTPPVAKFFPDFEDKINELKQLAKK